MQRVACIWVVFLLAPSDVAIDIQSPERLKNIDFLGLGYDVFIGDPMALEDNLRDPGFRQPVINKLYNEQKASSDGRWLQPDNTFVQRTVSCNSESESLTINTAISYRNAMSTVADIKGGFFKKASFSASRSFSEVRSGTSEQEKTYVTAQARCMVYHVGFSHSDTATYELTGEFFNDVMNLPITNVGLEKEFEEKYRHFIKSYGTHYAVELDMGAKLVCRSEFDKTSWQSLQQSEVDIAGAAKASFFKIFKFGASASRSERNDLAHKFESSRASHKTAYIGSRPPMDGNWETWASTTDDDPYPIKYELLPLTDLLRTRFFPKLSESELAARREMLNISHSVYCNSLPGCKRDLRLAHMSREVKTIVGEGSVSCPSGYKLLSCGINNTDTLQSDVIGRFSKPSDEDAACECYSGYGANCVAWCTNAVDTFTSVTQSSESELFEAACSTDKKVLGCHFSPPKSLASNSAISYYPTSAGDKCICYNKNGGFCEATCSANIKDYSVQSLYGKGHVTVNCLDGDVLGCGVNATEQGAQWRTALVTASGDGCQCYDPFGTTCYAICGLFNQTTDASLMSYIRFPLIRSLGNTNHFAISSLIISAACQISIGSLQF